MSVSVLILTLNEEINLPDCLNSVSWSDDIVVFDSFSTDKTVEIAQQHGARVVQRKFDNYANQRNAALTEVDYNNDWILMVDADERWDKAMFDEMQDALQKDDGNKISIYHFTRKDYFFGKHLKHSIATSTWSGRLVRKTDICVKREINEEYHTNGAKAYLSSQFKHYPFNKGIDYWLARHNKYSSMEASALIVECKSQLSLKDLFSADPTLRRKFLKQLAYRLPCRPFLVFSYLYIVKMGFLDGFAGFTYCRLRAIYEYLIDLKVKELRRREEKTTL